MNENKRTFTHDYGGKTVTIETGRLAKQADGAALVSSGGTQVLVTACSARVAKEGQDFFPLLVEYTEKFYSAGKFLGGFLKREGRPSIQEALNARLIDRPIRPLFPEGYMFETVVSCTVMSYAEDGDPEVLAGIGASAALSVSDIPFRDVIATCKVGRIGGRLVINPDYSQWQESDLQIAVAGSEKAILMVEGEASVVPEEEVLEAIFHAHEHIKGLAALIGDIKRQVGREKREFRGSSVGEGLAAKLEGAFAGRARECLDVEDKMERQRAVGALEDAARDAVAGDPDGHGLAPGADAGKEAAKAVDKLLFKMMRGDILDKGKRIGGRGLDEVRPVETEVNVLKSPHGSALFTRGETQVLATATIGGSSGDQMVDRIVGQSYNKFYLHYNFPPYSVGEARGVRGVGRREHGHGNLAERALKKVLPDVERFAYTIRVVCEVLESNGSSSMGSVCAGSMALMDAGVPLAAPVAGVAMGLVMEEGGRHRILTDILGDEDHLGDMDFKVAGPRDGVTAIQMDIKTAGLSREVVREAMMQARKGRLHILDKMAGTIERERREFKEGVPRIESFKIDQDKIGSLIGPGGKHIKALQEKHQTTIEVLEDGTIRVLGTDKEAIAKCIEMAQLQVNGPAIGSEYQAKVVSIKEYGAFVDIVDGVSGLVHVSEITNGRVHDVNDYMAVGDVVAVKVVEIDRMGRLKLSAKQIRPLPRKEGGDKGGAADGRAGGRPEARAL